MGPRPLPEPPAGRLRAAREALTRATLAGHLRRRDRHAAGHRRAGSAACRPPSRARRTDGRVWHWLADPWSGEIMRRAFAEVVLLGIDRRRDRLLGRPQRALPTAPSRSPTRCCPGLVLAALAGAPLLLGGAAGLLAAAVASRSPARRRGRPRQPPSPSSSPAVRARRAAGALARHAARLQGLLFGDILGHHRQPTCSPRPHSRRDRGGAAAAARAPARRRASTGLSAPALGRAARRVTDLRCWSCSR